MLLHKLWQKYFFFLIPMHAGSPLKFIKNRIDWPSEFSIQVQSDIEGDGLMDKLEKITYEIKFEPTPEGGSRNKTLSTYYIKGDNVLTEEEIKRKPWGCTKFLKPTSFRTLRLMLSWRWIWILIIITINNRKNVKYQKRKKKKKTMIWVLGFWFRPRLWSILAMMETRSPTFYCLWYVVNVSINKERENLLSLKFQIRLYSNIKVWQ